MRPGTSRTGYVLSAVITVAAAVALVGWNGSRFIGAQAKIRTKELTFLPSPGIARAMSLGHTNSMAKLRWIDSFAYFELQLERKDDIVSATGDSTFSRLYAMLTKLDPKFLPYYQHASLNLGGVLGRHGSVLSILNAGLMELPHESHLWRMLAAEYLMAFGGESKQAQLMDGLLAAWYEAETTEEGRNEVWTWKKAMGRRVYQDLSQLPYWEAQLQGATPGTPAHTFIVTTMREQVARFGENQLALLIAAWTKKHGQAPAQVAELAAPELVAEVWPKGIPVLGPIVIQDGRPLLRVDPFGYPYELQGGKVISPGWQLNRVAQLGFHLSQQLAEKAKANGRWPTSIDEAKAAGVKFQDLPAGCYWRLKGQQIDLELVPPPHPPWEPRSR